MNSLAARLTLAASLVLLGFMVATGFALEKAFSSSALQAMQDRLQGLSYAMLGAANVSDEGGFSIDEGLLPDERLLQPDSGLSALVLSENGQILWRSVSSSGVISLPKAPGVGEWLFQESRTEDTPFVLGFGFQWALSESEARRYVLLIVEQADTYYAQLAEFRSTLLIWLSLGAAVLLIAQLLVLRWGLGPLRTLVQGLRQIKEGKTDVIGGRYPVELSPLVDGLNALLRHERGRQARIRNALDDLAHSAKTPLAVLRGSIESGALEGNERRKFLDQIDRLDQIVRYQLQKAAARGRSALLRGEQLEPIVQKIASALAKVYREKPVDLDLDCPENFSLMVDADDLMELWGNLLDNAYKWCRSHIRLSVVTGKSYVMVMLEDDGPGFPVDMASNLIERGARADSQTEGQGIGLAVVSDIVTAYGGKIRLEKSDLGGARVCLEFPLS